MVGRRSFPFDFRPVFYFQRQAVKLTGRVDVFFPVGISLVLCVKSLNKVLDSLIFACLVMFNGFYHATSPFFSHHLGNSFNHRRSKSKLYMPDAWNWQQNSWQEVDKFKQRRQTMFWELWVKKLLKLIAEIKVGEYRLHKLFYEWKITILDRRYISNLLFFHCHGSFRWCRCVYIIYACIQRYTPIPISLVTRWN